MKRTLYLCTGIGSIVILFFLVAPAVFSEIVLEAPSLTVIVENEDGSKGLSGVEVTMKDNYDVLGYREEQTRVTDKDGRAVFDASAFDNFTVHTEGMESETFVYGNHEKQYTDDAQFNVTVSTRAPYVLSAPCEVEVPVSEEVEYTIHLEAAPL